MTADTFAPWPEPPYVATLRSNVAALTAALDGVRVLADEWEAVRCGVLSPGLRAAVDALCERGIVQNLGGRIMGVDHDFAMGGPQDTPLGVAGPVHACPATAALDAITAACTEACDNRRRTYPTNGLVSAALIAAIAEEART